MDESQLEEIARELAEYLIESGRVKRNSAWFIADLATELMMEAEDRGYDNATEIADMAVQLYS